MIRTFRIKSRDNFKISDIVDQIKLAAENDDFNGKYLLAKYEAETEELVIEFEVW